MATMSLWNKEALKSMREELGVCMKDPGMIKRLEKSRICSPANPTLGFLSHTQLEKVESEKTPTEKMSMVIDFLVEMEDKYFEYFCKILEQSAFEGKAKMLRDKAEKYKSDYDAEEKARIDALRPPPQAGGDSNDAEEKARLAALRPPPQARDDSNGSSTGTPSYIS